LTLDYIQAYSLQSGFGVAILISYFSNNALACKECVTFQIITVRLSLKVMFSIFPLFVYLLSSSIISVSEFVFIVFVLRHKQTNCLNDSSTAMLVWLGNTKNVHKQQRLRISPFPYKRTKTVPGIFVYCVLLFGSSR
jgi:cellulose synthase/poly-beta-1,6-N-acetylglucosamine synthase-like glycosyltransferase